MTTSTPSVGRRGARRSSPERRLAAYALASGAVLAASGRADASVIYSGTEDLAIGSLGSGFYSLDLNGDGRGDFALIDKGLSVFVLPVSPALNAVVGHTEAPGTPFADALAPGVLISSSSPFLAGGSVATLAYKTTGAGGKVYAGDFAGAGDRFLGLEFQIPSPGASGEHYAWARVNVQADPGLWTTIVDWAYESTPGTGIVTGAGIAPESTPGTVTQAVPEPSTMALGLLAAGSLGVSTLAKSRRRAAGKRTA
jgi:hypothetical protein